MNKDAAEGWILIGLVAAGVYVAYQIYTSTENAVASAGTWIDNAENVVEDDLNYIFNPSQWGIVQ